MYQCDVQTSKQTKIMWGDPGMLRPQGCWRLFALRYETPNKKLSGGLPGALIMPQTHRFVVLYIRLWMWARQVPPGPTAVGWILLQHQYLQCWQLIAAPAWLKTTLTCWTLNSLLCPFNMDLYIDASLERGVARHNWLCEWAILLFWEGLENKKKVLF